MSLLVLAGLVGCVDQGFSAVKLDAIAVVNGDFDDIGETLARNEIGSQPFNGYISQSTTYEGDERPTREDPGKTVEQLLTQYNAEGTKVEIQLFNAVFINSGTRGLNAWEYNNTFNADDSILLDEEAVRNVCDFPEGGGSLFVTDWAYDIVEACWPDKIEFENDDSVVDAAQVGQAGEVLADVPDKDLADALGLSVVDIEYNYSAFSVMNSVRSDVEVLLKGDISYQPEGATAYEVHAGVPMAVRFTVGHSGQVVFTNFHLFAQTASVADAILFRGIEGIEAGNGSKSAEAVE